VRNIDKGRLPILFVAFHSIHYLFDFLNQVIDLFLEAFQFFLIVNSWHLEGFGWTGCVSWFLITLDNLHFLIFPIWSSWFLSVVWIKLRSIFMRSPDFDVCLHATDNACAMIVGTTCIRYGQSGVSEAPIQQRWFAGRCVTA
jgi:hypothetical protein